VSDARETLDRLRAANRGERGDEGLDEPAGGWPPANDDEGDVIADPPPTEPTDVPRKFVEEHPPTA
jgi:hypothetical protein